MFDTIITNLLNKYVKDYVEEFTSDNLSISVISGTVELSNLFVKKDSLTNLNLPIRILFGYLDKVTVEVPYLTLQSNPVIVKVRRVFLLVGPRAAELRYNEKKEKASKLAAKRKKMEVIERNMELALNERGAPDPLASDLLTGIVKNLQLTVDDIHICYEDLKVNPECPFSFGLTLKRLTIRVSETLNPRKSEKCTSDYFRKDIILQFLSLYCNCGKKSKFKTQQPKKNLIRSFIEQIAYEGYKPKVTYLLHPSIMILSIWLNRNPEDTNYSIPKVDLDLYVDNLDLKVNGLQLDSAMLLVDTLGRSVLSGKFKKWRPKYKVMDHPRAWWRFAIKAIIESKLASKRNWSWSHIKMYHRKVKEYEGAYIKYKMDGSGEEKMDELEALLDIHVMVFIRERANMKIKKQKAQKKEEDTGIFSWFSSSSGEDDMLQMFQQQLSSKDREQLMNAMDAKPINFPESYEAYLVSVTINEIRLCLIDKSISKKMLTFGLDDFTSNLKYRPTSQGIDAKMKIHDISLKGVNRNDMIINESKGEFLQLAAETNPVDKDYDLSLIVKLRKLDLVVHTPTAFGIMEMFVKEDKEENLPVSTMPKSNDSVRLKKVKRRNAQALKKSINKASILNMDITIEPITIVIPDQGSLEDGKDILVLCSGGLQVTSSGGSKEKPPEQGKQTESKLVQTLRQKAYETLKINISGTKVILAPKNDLDNVLKASESQQIQHILKPFGLDVNVMRSYVPNDPEMPLLKVKCTIPEISLETKQSSIVRVIKLLVSVAPPVKKSAPKAVTIPAPLEKPPVENEIKPESLKALADPSESKLQSKKGSKTGELSEKNVKNEKKKSRVVKGQIVEIMMGFVLGKISCIIKTEDDRDLFNFYLDTLNASVEKKTSDLIASFFLTSLAIKGLDVPRNETIDIFEASKSKNLIQVKFEKITTKTKLKIEMSGFVLMIVINYLVRITGDLQRELKKLPQKPKQRKPRVVKTPKAKKATDASKSSENSNSPSGAVKSSLIFIFRMPQIDIFILESLNAKDPLAFVFSASASIDLKAEGKESFNAHGGIHQIQLGLTGLKKFQSDRQVDWYILSPFGLNFKGETSGRQSQKIKLQLVSEEEGSSEEVNDVKIIISPFVMQQIMSLGKPVQDGEEEEEADRRDCIEEAAIEEAKSVGAKKFFSPKPINLGEYEFLSKDVDVVGDEEDLDLAPPSAELADDSTDKQQLVLETNSITIIVESGGQDSQALIKFFTSHTITLDNWAENDLRVSLTSSFHMIFYNENKFSWEPIIEQVDDKPWQLEIRAKIKKDEQRMIVLMRAKLPLEVCLTKSALELIGDLPKALIAGLKSDNEEDLIQNTIEISNFTGMALQIGFDDDNFEIHECLEKKKNPESKKEQKKDNLTPVEQGDTINLVRVRELSSIKENKLTCYLDYDGQSLALPLYLTRGGPRAFGFPEPNEEGMELEWTFKMEKRGLLSKVLTFGTMVQLVNYFDVPLKLFCTNMGNQDDPGVKGEKNSKGNFLWEIPAEKRFYMPVNIIYAQSGEKTLYVKPSNNFNDSDVGVAWDPITVRGYPRMTVRCASSKGDENFYIRVKRTMREIHFGASTKLSPNHLFTTLEFFPMMKIRNLLPIPIELTLVDKNAGGGKKKLMMKPGLVEKVSHLDFERNHEISFKISDYLKQEWTSKNIFPSDWANKDNQLLILRFNPSKGEGILRIAVNFAEEGEEDDDCRMASIFSPFWMVNNTGKKIIYKMSGTTLEHPLGLELPLLLCQGAIGADKSVSIAFEDSEFSELFPIASVGSRGNVVAKAKNDFSYCVSVETELSKFALTNIVTISPFYLIINKTDQDIEVTTNDKKWTLVKSKSKNSLWPTDSQCFLRIRCTSAKGQPSKRISLKNPLSTLCTLDEIIFSVGVDIRENDIVVQVCDYFLGSAPVQIFNLLEDSIVYGQSSSKIRKQLPSRQCVYYTWSDPSQSSPKLAWKVADVMEEEIEVGFIKDGSGESEKGLIYWASFVYGQQRILLITEDRALTEASTKQTEVDHPLVDVEIAIKGLGISLVDDELQREVMYISIMTSDIVWEARELRKRHFKPLKFHEIDELEIVYQELKRSIEPSKIAKAIEPSGSPKSDESSGSPETSKPQKSSRPPKSDESSGSPEISEPQKSSGSHKSAESPGSHEPFRPRKSSKTPKSFESSGSSESSRSPRSSTESSTQSSSESSRALETLKSPKTAKSPDIPKKHKAPKSSESPEELETPEDSRKSDKLETSEESPKNSKKLESSKNHKKSENSKPSKSSKTSGKLEKSENFGKSKSKNPNASKDLGSSESSKSPEEEEDRIIREVEGMKVDLTDENAMKILEPFKGSLRRTPSSSIWLGISLSENVVQVHLKVFQFQIDNQMDDYFFPVVIAQKSPPPSVALTSEPKPFLEVSMVMQRQMNLVRFNYLAVLIQEVMVQIDGVFLLGLVKYASSMKSKETNYEEKILQSLEQAFKDKVDYSMVAASSRIHCDLIHVSPIKAVVSFTLIDSKVISIIPVIDFLLRSLCVTLSEFRDLTFKINFFERKNVLMNASELVSEIAGHYVRQGLSQFYVVVLGFSVLGNPAGVLLGLGRGIGNLFYEPYLGIIEGPQEFVKGLGIGVHSLVKGTVGGAAGAIEKITGTLGQGIATLSMDDDEIKRRNELLREKPGLVQRGGMLLTDVTHGITGVVTKPIKGHQEGGIAGLLKGFGRGIIGIVADPITGLLDFTSGAFGSVKRTIDNTEDATRQRPPRNFHPDGIIRSYNKHEALGSYMYKYITKGEADDHYVSHYILHEDSILIVTDQRLMLASDDSSGTYTHIWDEPLSGIRGVQITEDGELKIDVGSKKSSTRTHEIPCTKNVIAERTKKGLDTILRKRESKKKRSSSPLSA